MSTPDSQRFDEMESRLAFLDHTVEELNKVVSRQDEDIRRLQARLSEMTNKLDDLSGAIAEGEPASQHEVPPHY
jgi:SlyX protein